MYAVPCILAFQLVLHCYNVASAHETAWCLDCCCSCIACWNHLSLPCSWRSATLPPSTVALRLLSNTLISPSHLPPFFMHACQVPTDTTEAPSQPASTLNVSEIVVPIVLVVLVVAVLTVVIVGVFIYLRWECILTVQLCVIYGTMHRKRNVNQLWYSFAEPNIGYQLANIGELICFCIPHNIDLAKGENTLPTFHRTLKRPCRVWGQPRPRLLH